MCTESAPAPQSSSGGSGAFRLLLLDVDNTLYREKDTGVEAQIIRGTHLYCESFLGIDKEKADQLYRQFGSTVEGLQRTVWKDLSGKELEERLVDFYKAVYENVDPSSILLPDVDAYSGSTGYSHTSKEERKLMRQLLKSSPLPIALASNSPSWHVHKVLRALGLEKLKSNRLGSFTPDRLPMYPTKHEPEEFFSAGGIDNDKSGLDRYRSVSFLDDSLYNLKRVRETFPFLVDRIHHVNRRPERDEINGNSDDNGEENLVQALLQDFGLIEPTFHLSQTRYLESKNTVDRRSLHVEIWNKVVNELEEALLDDSYEASAGAAGASSDLWIVDLGAGLLSMLDLLLHGDEILGLSSLLSSSSSLPIDSESKTIHYTAYESNKELYELSHERLLSWGFAVIEKEVSDEDEGADIIDYQKKQNGVNLRIKLILRNFANVKKDELLEITEKMTPNLIIGCCFADLMDPEQLVPDLLRSFGLLNASPSLRSRTWIYFPITFTGTTQFLPPRPFEFQSNEKTVPSDTVGFQSYSRALERVLGHNLNPFLLQEVMEDHGANLIDFGSSDWKIDPERDFYLYETMLYFLGSTGGPQLLKEGWDAAGWIQRAHTNKPSIQVSNRDLLFSIEHNYKIDHNEISNERDEKDHFEEILFTAPSQVTSVERNFPSQLGPRKILGKCKTSLRRRLKKIF